MSNDGIAAKLHGGGHGEADQKGNEAQLYAPNEFEEDHESGRVAGVVGRFIEQELISTSWR